jgi:hypothetical protein
MLSSHLPSLVAEAPDESGLRILPICIGNALTDRQINREQLCRCN